MKQAPIVTEPPPCFTIGILHFGSNSSPDILQTITLPSELKRLNFHSSNQTITFFQKSTGFSSISLANLSHFLRLILFTYGFLRVTRLTSCTSFRIVPTCNGIPRSFSISTFTVEADFGQSSLSLS